MWTGTAEASNLTLYTYDTLKAESSKRPKSQVHLYKYAQYVYILIFFNWIFSNNHIKKMYEFFILSNKCNLLYYYYTYFLYLFIK